MRSNHYTHSIAAVVMIHWHIIWYLLGVWDVSFRCILFFDKPLMFEDFPWSLCMQHVCFPESVVTCETSPPMGCLCQVRDFFNRSRRKKVNHVGILRGLSVITKTLPKLHVCIPLYTHDHPMNWWQWGETWLCIPWNSDLRSGVDGKSHGIWTSKAFFWWWCINDCRQWR